MLLEDPDRTARLFCVKLRSLHRDHDQISLADGEQHDLGNRPFEIDDDERRAGGNVFDPVEDIILIDIGNDRQVVGQRRTLRPGCDWMIGISVDNANFRTSRQLGSKKEGQRLFFQLLPWG